MAERNNLTAASQGQESAERTADEIRHDIAARRESITDTVDRLSDRFQRTFDWRTYVSEYPLAALGVAAGVGFLTYRMFKRRSSPGDRIRDAIAYGFEDLSDRFRHQLDFWVPHKSSFSLGRTVKAAATGLVTKAVTDYLQHRFAGGYDQYSEYMPEYMGRYPAGDVDYPGSDMEDQPSAGKKDREPRH